MNSNSKVALKYYLSDKAKNAAVEFLVPRTGDAGFDLRALNSQVVAPGEQILVETGLHLAIPEGWVGLVRDRSSMALKRVYSHAGVIDSHYRGEVKVVLSNAGGESYHIEVGDKVAQLVLVPCLTEAETCNSLEELGTTERGAGGFGSTGRS